MILDHYKERIPNQFPEFFRPEFIPLHPSSAAQFSIVSTGVSREEFEELKKVVLEMKELLIKAKLYDEKNGEPDCESKEKIDLLKQIASIMGVNLEEIFKK